MAVPRRNHRIVLLATGRLLAIGGEDGSGVLSSCELYDPTTGTWAATGPLVGARSQHGATLLPSGRVLATGGHGAGGQAMDSEAYDPTSGTWAVVAGATNLREGHTATLLPSGRVLLSGGLDGTGAALDRCEAYVPGMGSWSATGSLLTERHLHTATLLPNGKVLVAAGMGFISRTTVGTTTTTRYGPLQSCELYDPATGIWSPGGSLKYIRQEHSAILLTTGKVLIAGGLGRQCELYDPETDTWSDTGSMVTGRRHHTATLLRSGKVLFAGGNAGAALAACELYDPTTGTWTATGSLQVARESHAATLLPNGKVLVTGGVNGSGSQSISELFDPETGTWTFASGLQQGHSEHTATLLPSGWMLIAGGSVSTTTQQDHCQLLTTVPPFSLPAISPLITARGGHRATLLLSGEVLVTGGTFPDTFSPLPTPPPGFRANGEIFDPASGKWRTTSDLAEPRRFGHTATLLPSGKVLIAGGADGSLYFSGIPHGICELFDPDPGIDPSSRPSLATWPAALPATTPFAITGVGFSGLSEASSGATNASATNHPLVQIRSAANEQVEWLAYDQLVGFTGSSVTTKQPSTLPPGPASLRVFVNGIPSSPAMVQVRVASLITWPTPALTTYGTPLSVTQLNAATGIPGTFTYSPAGGAVLDVGSHTLAVTFAPTDPDAYTTASATVTLTVQPAVLTATADDTTRDYGATNPAFTGSLVGALASDDISATYASAATTSTDAGTYGPATANAIIPTLGDPNGRLGNYTVTVAKGTLTVAPAALTVIADDATRAYGAANPAFTGTVTGAMAADGLSATYASSATAATAAGVYGPATAEAIIPTLVDPNSRLGNYSVTTTKGTLTVGAATLTITADDLAMVAGQPVPALTATASGLIAPDTLASLDTPPVIATSATSASPPGSYPITVSGAADGDYAITQVAGTLTIAAPAGSGNSGAGGGGGGGCGLGGALAALTTALLLTLRLSTARRRRGDRD
jgi:hypothetical protein